MIGDGWESLGDMGWMDADGYLYLSDRKTDMLLVGGSNVYPAEIEKALAGIAGVIDLDGPLLLKQDRVPAIRFDGSLMQPPPPDLWG